MRNDFCSGYLKHHGIQGQKWGVKNGPPYPLNASKKSDVNEENEAKNKGLSKEAKTLIGIGTIAATATLATYAMYKIGGPKVIASKLSQFVSNGKKASNPYMKTNLQYFAKKKREAYNFKSKEEYARVMHVFNSVPKRLKSEPYLALEIQSNDGPGGGAYRYFATNLDGYGDFKVTRRVKISKSGTGTLKRNKYDKWE